MRAVMLVALTSLALGAAACGGGGSGGKTLTKAEYAATLSQACKDSNDKLNALSLTSITSFKDNGDAAVKIADDSLKEFKALKAPDAIKDAAKTFIDSADQIVTDLKNAVEAAKKDDETAFAAAVTAVQTHGKENDGAASEIGATECVSG